MQSTHVGINVILKWLLSGNAPVSGPSKASARCIPPWIYDLINTISTARKKNQARKLSKSLFAVKSPRMNDHRVGRWWSRSTKCLAWIKERSAPSVILRSDGTALYATEDLALVKHKFGDYPDLEKSLYLVDVRQSLHFTQVFKILEIFWIRACQKMRTHFLRVGNLARQCGHVLP